MYVPERMLKPILACTISYPLSRSTRWALGSAFLWLRQVFSRGFAIPPGESLTVNPFPLAVSRTLCHARLRKTNKDSATFGNTENRAWEACD